MKLNRKGQSWILAVVGVVAVLGIIMWLATCGMVTVSPNEVAVEIDKVGHQVLQEPHGVGYYVYNRWKTDMVSYTISSRSYPADGTNEEQDVVKTSDGQNVTMKMSIIYSLNSKDVPALHQEIGPDYETQILLPQIRSEARLAISNYTAEDIYTGKARDEMQMSILDRLTSSMKSYPAINIHSVLVKGFTFSQAFEEQIEQKQLQSQQVEINKNKALAQEQTAKQQEAQAEGAKLQAIQEAEGKAQAIRLQADAERYALEQQAAGNLAKYKAEAEGKKLAAEALGGGQYVVALKFAEMIAPDLKIYAAVPAGNTNIMDLTGVLKGIGKEQGVEQRQ